MNDVDYTGCFVDSLRCAGGAWILSCLRWCRALAVVTRMDWRVAMLTPKQKEIATRVTRECGTGGWQTLDDMVLFAERFLAALPPAVPQVGTNNYVQAVPNHCDRIIWRGYYYSLPTFLTSTPVATAPQPADDVVRDAERYRWLRSSSERNGIWYGSGENFFHKDQLDAAIDAAMAKEKA